MTRTNETNNYYYISSFMIFFVAPPKKYSNVKEEYNIYLLHIFIFDESSARRYSISRVQSRLYFRTQNSVHLLEGFSVRNNLFVNIIIIWRFHIVEISTTLSTRYIDFLLL